MCNSIYALGVFYTLIVRVRPLSVMDIFVFDWMNETSLSLRILLKCAYCKLAPPEDRQQSKTCPTFVPLTHMICFIFRKFYHSQHSVRFRKWSLAFTWVYAWMSPLISWVTVVRVPKQLSRNHITWLLCAVAAMVPSTIITLMFYAKHCICPCSEINVVLLMMFLVSNIFCQGKQNKTKQNKQHWIKDMNHKWDRTVLNL